MNVPYTEQMTGSRTVQKRVPVTTTKTVQVRGGHWENQMVEVAGGTDACGCPCPPKQCCKRVWVPTCETKEVPCTTYQCVTEEVPYTYSVTKCRQEQRSRMVNVTKCRNE